MNKDKMELEEAIKLLKKSSDFHLQVDREPNKFGIAIKTVLQALENSIPKKKIEDKIEELKNIESQTCKKIFNSQRTYWTEVIEDILQELLEEK